MPQTREDLAKAMMELVQQQLAEIPPKLASLQRNGEAILKLQQAGLTTVVVGPACHGTETIHVDRADLPKVRKALGKLRRSYASVIDSDQRTIRVYLEAADYPGIQVAFKAVLPENGRCRIETRQFTSASLVCDR